MAAALPEGSLPRGSVTPALAGSAPMGNFFVVIALFRLAVLGLCGCMGFSLGAESGPLSSWPMGFSLRRSMGPRARGLQSLQHVGSVAAARRLESTGAASVATS